MRHALPRQQLYDGLGSRRIQGGALTASAQQAYSTEHRAQLPRSLAAFAPSRRRPADEHAQDSPPRRADGQIGGLKFSIDWRPDEQLSSCSTCKA